MSQTFHVAVPVSCVSFAVDLNEGASDLPRVTRLKEWSEGRLGQPDEARMLTTLRTAFHLFVARQYLRDLAYLTDETRILEVLGRDSRRIGRIAVREGWSTRTTASVLAALWYFRSATALDPERKMRVARSIVEQEDAGVGPLDWFDEYAFGRLNAVGTDMMLMRYNVGRGTIAFWIVEQRKIDPEVLRIFTTMAAWGLADSPPDQVQRSYDAMLGELS